MDQKSQRSWGGALFGMIFLVAGIAAGYFISGKMIIGYMATSSWVEVPAIIRSVELKSHRGDTTTYSVKSDYSYNVKGVTYHSDRVSLSTGSDNVGSYWQDLARSLRSQQRSNEALAIVNPKDPTESLLDRTFRWKSVVFGLIFLTIFGGFGGFFVWFSLRETESSEVRLQRQQSHGITCNDNVTSKFLAVFGGIFLIIGGGFTIIAIPDAIRGKEYGAFFVLLFPLVGACIMWFAFKMNRAYRRFGPTPLSLDPLVPGIGGQLGGRFNINAPGNNLALGNTTQLLARLLCKRITKGRDNNNVTVIWSEEVPVYVEQTATGVECKFLFDIPDTCTPSRDMSKRTAIDWSVVVEGDFHAAGLGKFERNWDVIVEDSAAQASNVLNIPQSFLHKAEVKLGEQARASARNQIPVTEDEDYITIHSKAGRHLLGGFLGVVFGGIFAAVGVISTMDGWLPGYVFILLGSAIAIASIYSLGKAIIVKVHRDTQVLYARVTWCGIPLSHPQGDIVDPYQFSLKKTSSSSTEKKVVEYYAIVFESNGKKTKIATGIVGKREAEAVRDSIINHCFDGPPEAIAA